MITKLPPAAQKLVKKSNFDEDYQKDESEFLSKKDFDLWYEKFN